MPLSCPRPTQLAMAAGLGLSACASGAAFAALRAEGVAAPHKAARGVVQASSGPDGPTSSAAPHVAGLAMLGVGAGAALLRKNTLARGPAVAQAKRAEKRVVAVEAFEKELGVQEPVGFWDPLGLAKDGNAATFARRRATEIKHGRVSMYACIGYIVPEYFRWPGELSPSEGIKFTDVPNGLGAFSKVPALGWFQILAFCGALEITGWTFSKGQNIGFGKDASVNGEPGNYGLGPLGFFNLIKKDPAQRARKLNAELANGRLAMIAIIGLFFQNGVTGTTGPEMYGFGENSGVILLKVLFPSLAAFGIMGETFRRGPDEKFVKLFKYTPGKP